MCFALQRIVKPSYCEHFENATVEAKISAKREVIPMVQSVLSFCALSFLWKSNSFKPRGDSDLKPSSACLQRGKGRHGTLLEMKPAVAGSRVSP